MRDYSETAEHRVSDSRDRQALLILLSRPSSVNFKESYMILQRRRPSSNPAGLAFNLRNDF
jgi:hypothetical protein